MHIIVLGAGVAGVSTAWYLAKAGHQVTVIDRAEAAAMETSFANAGQLSYGYTTPWAAPEYSAKSTQMAFQAAFAADFHSTAACFNCVGCADAGQLQMLRTIT